MQIIALGGQYASYQCGNSYNIFELYWGYIYIYIFLGIMEEKMETTIQRECIPLPTAAGLNGSPVVGVGALTTPSTSYLLGFLGNPKP